MQTYAVLYPTDLIERVVGQEYNTCMIKVGFTDMRKFAYALFVSIASPVLAHEFTDITVTGFREMGPITVIDMQDTAKGHEVICALYDVNGELLASTPAYTDNLASTAPIPGTFPEAVEARCVLND